MGNTTKLAKEDVGQYIKRLAATDPAVWNAYQALRKAGGKVYVVGGAVRDALLQKQPKDIDLMVTGIPSEQVNNVLSGSAWTCGPDRQELRRLPLPSGGP
jgi:tRNA nucleotidyltransferase/poly(A) polymerase